VFGQNVTEHNPAPSPSGHPLLSGPPTLNDIHQIFISWGEPPEPREQAMRSVPPRSYARS
jgi:hypothetical protein